MTFELILRFDVSTILDVLYYLFTQIALISKVINFIINRNNLLIIEDVISTKEFRSVTKNTQNIFHEIFKNTGVVATWYRITCLCAFFFYAVFPIVDWNSDSKVPLRSWYPFDEEKYNTYIYIFQIFSIFASAYNNSGIDLLTVRLISLALAQYDVLKDKLIHFYNENEDVFEGEYEKDVVLRTRLKYCIQHHVLILRFV